MVSASDKFVINRLQVRLPAVRYQVTTWMGDRPWAGKLSRYVTSHPGQLSLAIPPWVGTMSSSQRDEGLLWLIGAVVCLQTVFTACIMLFIVDCGVVQA